MKRIVIACDGSDYAENAARFVARLPHKERLDITVVSVIEQDQAYFQYAPEDWTRNYIDSLRKDVVDSYDRIQSYFEGSNSELNHTVLDGPTGHSLTEFATNAGADLIVLGAKGRSEVSRILLGSISDYVATHAKSSVLVVRPTLRQEDQAPLKVALAYDAKEPAKKMLREFASIPWGADVEADIITTLGSLVPSFGDARPDAQTIKRTNEAIDQAASEISKVVPGARGTLIHDSHVADGIIHFIEKHHSDLVFLGERTQNPIARFLMGSVSRFVLRHAPCSVWISRND